MKVPAESLSGPSVRDKVVTAAEAVRLIRDGDAVVVEGFVGQGFAEELTLALEERFLQTGRPRDLTLVFTVAQGNRQGRGLDRLCYEGLVKRAVGGHWALSPELGKMALENKIEAHNLPQGAISQLFRDTAAGKPGLLTRVGLGTFVDPRHGGGKINERTTEDRVELITLDGEEYLFYKSLRARCGVPARHHRGSRGEHHHGARGADPGGPRGGHRGAQRRWLGDRAGGAGRRERQLESARGEDPRHTGRLRRRLAARAPLADLRHCLLARAERRAAAGAQLDLRRWS